MIYSRFTNPTVEALEQRLAAMEEGEQAIASCSGMAAICMTLLHFLKQGDTIISHPVIYGGAFEFLANIVPKFGIKTRFVDFTNIDKLEKSIDKSTKILYFESPTNPRMEIINISEITRLAKKHKIISIIDNTFAPPPVQYPINLGIDIVIHSLTKYIGGHSDLIGGVVIGSKKIISDIYSKSYFFFGPTLSPFTAFLAARGLTTLVVRIKQMSQNAQLVAEFLEKQPKISKVYYPGLKTFAQYALAKKQMKYFGGVMSFEVKGGYKSAEKLVNSVKLITLAVSLGAVESLIEHPASMTHSEMNKEERSACGISDGLIRLSVGIEDIEDIISDLQQALGKS